MCAPSLQNHVTLTRLSPFPPLAENSNDLVVAPGETVSLSADSNTYGSITVQAGGVLEYTSEAQSIDAGVVTVAGAIRGLRVTLRCHSLDVQASGAVHADGFSVDTTGWPGSRALGDATAAAYANVPSGSAASAYGSLTLPTSLGSVPTDHSNTPKAGGAVHVQASTNIHVAAGGRISANAVVPGGPWTGGLTGGSVLLQADMLSGAGVIEANGGPGRYMDGSGGRVAIHIASSTTFVGTVQALAVARNGYDSKLPHGTVFLDLPGVTAPDEGNITIPNGATFTQVVLTGTPTLDAVTVGVGATLGVVSGSSFATLVFELAQGATFHVSANPVDAPPDTVITLTGAAPPVFAPGAWIKSTASPLLELRSSTASLTLPSGAPRGVDMEFGSLRLVVPTVTLPAQAKLQTGGRLLNITATAVTVAANAEIAQTGTTTDSTLAIACDTMTVQGIVRGPSVLVEVTSLVVTGQDAAVHADNLGALALTCARHLGCSHGSRSGNVDPAVVNDPYGDPLAPTTHGCWCTNSNLNDAGGAVKIVASSIALGAGAHISADSINVERGHGGASGGSVWIRTDVLTGHGRISADSLGMRQQSLARAGSGGRVSVTVATEPAAGDGGGGFQGTFSAHGGTHASGYQLRFGTVYLSLAGVVELYTTQQEADAGALQGRKQFIKVPTGATFHHLFIPLASATNEAQAPLATLQVGAGATASIAAPGVDVDELDVPTTASLLLHAPFEQPQQVVKLQYANMTGGQLYGTILGQDCTLQLTLPTSLVIAGVGKLGSMTSQDDPALQASLELTASTSVELLDAASLEASTTLTITAPVVSFALNTEVSVPRRTSGKAAIHASTSLALGGLLEASQILIVTEQLTLTTDNSLISATGLGTNAQHMSLGSLANVQYYGASHGAKTVKPPEPKPGLVAEAFGNPLQPTEQGPVGYSINYGGGAIRIIATTLDFANAASW